MESFLHAMRNWKVATSTEENKLTVATQEYVEGLQAAATAAFSGDANSCNCPADIGQDCEMTTEECRERREILVTAQMIAAAGIAHDGDGPGHHYERIYRAMRALEPARDGDFQAMLKGYREQYALAETLRHALLHILGDTPMPYEDHYERCRKTAANALGYQDPEPMELPALTQLWCDTIAANTGKKLALSDGVPAILPHSSELRDLQVLIDDADDCGIDLSRYEVSSERAAQLGMPRDKLLAGVKAMLDYEGGDDAGQVLAIFSAIAENNEIATSGPWSVPSTRELIVEREVLSVVNAVLGRNNDAISFALEQCRARVAELDADKAAYFERLSAQAELFQAACETIAVRDACVAELDTRLALMAKETDADKKPMPATKEFPADALRPSGGDPRRVGG